MKKTIYFFKNSLENSRFYLGISNEMFIIYINYIVVMTQLKSQLFEEFKKILLLSKNISLLDSVSQIRYFRREIERINT